MMITPEVLRESIAARNLSLEQLGSEQAKEIICAVKPIKFANWLGIDFITVAQAAHFYNINAGVIRYKTRKSYQDEFTRDGVKCVVDKKDTLEAHYALSAAKNTAQIIICPPKAVLRLAMILSIENNLAYQIVESYLNRSQTKEIEAKILPQAALVNQFHRFSKEMLKINQQILQLLSANNLKTRDSQLTLEDEEYLIEESESFFPERAVINGNYSTKY